MIYKFHVILKSCIKILLKLLFKFKNNWHFILSNCIFCALQCK